MTAMSLPAAVSRIKTTPPESPIAVFRHHKAPGMLDCVFAATIATQTRIKHRDPDYIGTFDWSLHPDVIREILKPYTFGAM